MSEKEYALSGYLTRGAPNLAMVLVHEMLIRLTGFVVMIIIYS